MEPDDLPSSPPPRRKLKFLPKAPARKKRPSPAPKSEAPGGENENREDKRDDAQAQRLLRRFNESRAKEGTRGEKKSTVQVAFGPGATSSNSIQTLGVPGVEDSGKGSSTRKKGSGDNVELKPSSYDTTMTDSTGFEIMDTTDGMIQPQKYKGVYKEPWDYEHSYYPITLPLRRPNAGDPEILNDAEFGEAARKVEYNENMINHASELGLLDANRKKEMIFFQFPANLPMVMRSATTKGKEKAESSSSSSKSLATKEKGCSLEDLPGGCIGKLLVYRSGAVKLKLGEVLYDVSPGSDCAFAQDVAAVNTVDKECCILGKLGKRAEVALDVDSLLNYS